jgi:hypothetical protein
MAEESKFTGVLAKLKEPPKEIPEAMLAEERAMHDAPSNTLDTPPVRGRGRPRSKSSDPDYQSTTVILRKLTKRKAARLLEDQEAGQDLSDLIEELLFEWIQKHS